MIQNIQLAAVVAGRGTDRSLRKMPLSRELQQAVGAQWGEQYDAFFLNALEVPFDAGYNLEGEERFVVNGFEPPAWLAAHAAADITALEPLDRHEEELEHVRGVAGFARHKGKDVILFQNFSRSHIIRPGYSFLLQRGTYQSIERPGVTLSDRLTGVLFPGDRKLLFSSFRGMNVIIPLADLYREAGEAEIREVLAHPQLAPVDVDALAEDPSQWFQKRFALLKDSEVLTKYTPAKLKNLGKKYNVEVEVKNKKLVFPAEKAAARKLLQFLNEEIFRGPITDTLYSTNSKRAET